TFKTEINEKSQEIATGIKTYLEARQGIKNEDSTLNIGAGDQGLMFGYACDETEQLMPLPISLAHQLSRQLTQIRKDQTLPYLRPDGKTQVTVEYDEQNRPKRVDAIIIST